MLESSSSDRGRRIGFALCSIFALYFLISVAFALLRWDLFASAGPQFVRYVVVPGLIAAVFLLVGLFASGRNATLVGVYGLSVLAGLFLFEGYLTARKVPVILGMLGQLDEDQRDALAGDDDKVRGFTLRSLNRIAGTERLPDAILSGFPHTEVILCSREGEVIEYRADRFGFNNPDEIHDAGPIEVVLLGDSFAEGFCLRPGEDLTARLRAEGLAAASLGIRGNGPTMELATLGRFGPALRPKHVVMAFFEGNDWDNLQKELGDPWLRAALEPDAAFGTAAAGAESARRALAGLRERTNGATVSLADLFRRRETLRNFVALQQTGTLLGLIYPKVPKDIPAYGDVLARTKSIAESWGGGLTLVYIPRVDRFVGALPVDRAFDQLRRKVLAAAADAGVPVIDLREAMRDLPNPAALYGEDAHFSAAGAAFAAKVVAERLRGPVHDDRVPDPSTSARTFSAVRLAGTGH